MRDLTVEFWTGDAYQTVVNHVLFEVNAGEAFGLVGESGSGKSTTVYALLVYHQPDSRIKEGSVIFQGVDLLNMPWGALQHMRGRKIGFVPQDPTTALTPNMHVGDQILPPYLAPDWPGVAQVARLVRTVTVRGVTSGEVVSLITSLPARKAGATRLLALVRAYWSSENSRPYVRDVTFGEDRSRLRTGTRPRSRPPCAA